MAHFVLVLSHMLQRDGTLNEESTKRALRGAEIFKDRNRHDFVITLGGGGERDPRRQSGCPRCRAIF